MKFPFPRFACCLVPGLLLLAAGSVRADAPPALAAAITQLDADLLVIPAGGTVSEAQHQAILADLTTLSIGILPAPGAADLAEVATTLEGAATAGNVTAESLADLNEDLADDASDADFWLDDILSDAQVLLHLQDPVNDDPNLPIETVGPIFTTAAPLPPRRTRTNRRFSLDQQQGQSTADQYYYGEVELVTRRVAGSQATNRFYVRALGLPLNNPYTVGIVRRSDKAHLTLGQMTVQEVSSHVFNLYLPADVPDTYQEELEILSLGRATLDEKDFGQVLPSGLDPQEVAAVTLTDAQGVTRLSGGFNNASFRNLTRGVVLHLRGDSAATAVAKASRFGVNKASYATFQLIARHLPASTLVTLVADGVPQGQFTTGKSGQLFLAEGKVPAKYKRSGARWYPQPLPKNVDLSRVKSLALIDVQGNTLAASED